MTARAAVLAKKVVTALFRPAVAAEQLGHQGIDLLTGWVQGEPKQRYQRLGEEIRQKLDQLPVHEIDGPQKLDAALSMAETLFASDGLIIDELVRLRLDRDDAMAEQTRRFNERRESRDEPEASICRQHVIPAIFDALFTDPEALEEIDLAFKQAVLEHLDDIQRLPGESAAALKRLAAQALVRKPYRRFDKARLASSALLQAEYAIVPFEGRSELLDDAIGWCADERDLGIRLYVGPGGMGKTRFAIELCDQVSVRMPEQGWRSGFLARGFAGVPEWLLPNLRDGGEPLLIVVDYAETKPQDLIQLLALAHDLHPGRKLRLLLLARSAGDWWSDLPTSMVGDGDGVSDDARAKARAILPGPAVDEPIDVGPLAAEVEVRPGVFERGLSAFKKQISHAAPPAPMPDLSGDDFRSVLMIHMAALAAVAGRTIADAKELMEGTLQRERAAWQRGLVAPSLRAVSTEDVQQAVTLVTLAGGAPNRSIAIEIIGRAPRLENTARALLDDLGNVLGGLYPSPLRADHQRDRPIEPLRPDLLGEELIDRALGDEPALLTAGLEGVSREQVHNGLTVLTRLAQRRPDAERWLEQALAIDLERLAEPAIQVAIETGHPMGRMLARALANKPIAEPSRLEPLIPERTTELRDVSVVVMAQQWSRLQAIPKPWANAVKAEAARVANHLANRLSDAGQHWQALRPALEALDLFGTLAELEPDTYQPSFATSLMNYGSRLSDVRRNREALAPAKEAVVIFRKLADKAPDAHQPDLAMALNNLAGCLSAVGQQCQALEVERQAAELYRELAAKKPDIFRYYLAGALSNLAIRLSEGGQHQEALEPAQESTDLYRDLADEAPDAYRPDLARALNNLAVSLSEVGRYEEALKAVLEGVRTLRPLFLRFPPAYRVLMPKLMRSYLIVCQELHREPDAELVAPILEVLRRMENGSGGE